MKRKQADPPTSAVLRPRFQISHHGAIGLGPGKAELLELIQETGSLAEASRVMGMSYMRAWQLVKAMNGCFREPLVETLRGGQDQGGSKLSPTGVRVLGLYRKLEREAELATRATWRELQTLLQTE